MRARLKKTKRWAGASLRADQSKNPAAMGKLSFDEIATLAGFVPSNFVYAYADFRIAMEFHHRSSPS